MREKILLSTFSIKILDGGNEQILSRFNGSDDFYSLFENFTRHIFTNPPREEYIDEGQTKSHLTLDGPINRIEADRVLYGYFSSGVSGERVTIKEIQTNETAFRVQPDEHGSYRDVFFYLRIPINRNIGYLVLQRKAKFGIKSLLIKTLNRYFRELGYSRYRIQINNFLHGEVYRTMLREGNLKKVDLVRRSIPSTLEAYYSEGERCSTERGVMKTTFTSRGSLPDYWKELVNRLFSGQQNQALTRIEIVDGQEVDEVEFELELDGKKKTFYVSNRERIQPDVNVTRNLDYGPDGEPTIASLLSESSDLIRDIFEINLSQTNVGSD